MTRLSKEKVYSILWLNHINKNIPTISKTLKISEKDIIITLEKNKNLENKTNIKEGSAPVKGKDNKIKSLMINETMGKKTKNVSIMTQAASSAYDQAKKKQNFRSNNKNIFRPNK